MKTKIILIIAPFIFLLSFPLAKSQEKKNFPFDPYVILKSWNYDFLVKTMGNGEEIMVTGKNQTYLAGLRYPSDLLGMHGKLEFNFVKDSISRIQFRQEHEVRVTSANPTSSKTKDPPISIEYSRAIQKLDSLQRRDSLSRDSVVKAISEILGSPISNSRTAVSEKNARHSAIWISRGYSCLYKDFMNYSEIIFSLSTVPLWAVGEFNIPAGTEILRKTLVNTRKMSWSASLLGFTSDAPKMIYSDFFLLLEFATGQRFLESIPKNPAGYLQTTLLLKFATGQSCLLSVPKNAIGYLPTLTFEDFDGDAIPDARIQVPADITGNQARYYIYSMQFKEPNLIFSSDDLIPSDISIQDGSRIRATFPDGTELSIESQKQFTLPDKTTHFKPAGFRFLQTTKLNTDGSTDFVGGIELRLSRKNTAFGTLEITYKHLPGGWGPHQIKVIPLNN
jgi:hypothetical protein